MKKSFLVLSLLLPAIAHAECPQGQIPNASTGVCETATPADPKPAPAEVRIEEAKKEEPKVEQCLSLVDDSQFKDAGLSLVLEKDSIKLKGSVPSACADLLALSDVQKFAAAKGELELKEAKIEKSDDVKDFLPVVRVQVSFVGDDNTPTLRDCISKHKAESKTELSGLSRMSRNLSNSKYALAGLDGGSLDVKSEDLKALEAQFSTLNCKDDCNSTWKKTKKNLDAAKGFDSDMLHGSISELVEKSIVDISKKIETVKTMEGLKEFRDQLLEMSKYATTQEQRDAIKELFAKLHEQNWQIAKSGKKTDRDAIAHADFAKETYSKMLELPELTADERADLKNKEKEMTKGSDDRVGFISTIDGDNSEVKEFLRKKEKDQRRLQQEAFSAGCARPQMYYNFTQCGEIQHKYDFNRKNMSLLQNNYVLANNENWTNMMAAWDKHGVAYDRNQMNRFIRPVAPISANSLPDVYDPKDFLYRNFDGSKLFQTNAVNGATPEANPLFAEQPYSIDMT